MKESLKTSLRIIVSGGGTGGHIFPAIALADQIKKLHPHAEFLFVGAKDKMEMQKVPQAGYAIKGLWISGFQRSLDIHNLLFPLKLIKSIWDSFFILKKFKPHFAIGTGGFASGPILGVASVLKIPIFLQEQNAFPGITNKILKNKATKIFVAYDHLEKYFPAHKIINSGNPIRTELFLKNLNNDFAKKKLNIDTTKLTILSVGGSLGSKTLNEAWLQNLDKIVNKDIHLIWQTGSLAYNKIKESIKTETPNIQIEEFIKDMGLVYAAADIIVSRAGAIAISELKQAGKCTILVPLPTAAEDHQTHNALQLVQAQAAIMIKDKNMQNDFWKTLENLIEKPELRTQMAKNLKQMAQPHSTEIIVKEIFKAL